VSLNTEESVRVYKLSKKEDTGAVTAQVAFDFTKVTDLTLLTDILRVLVKCNNSRCLVSHSIWCVIYLLR